MKITLKKEVFQKFHPQFQIAFLLAQGLDNQAKLKESRHLLQEVEVMVPLLFHPDTLKTHSLLSPWATLQHELDPRAAHYQTSLEKLLAQVLKKKKIQARDTLTNLLNYISLKHLVPLTVDDFHKLKGSLTFQLSTGKERASLLKKLKKNALYYRDQKNILGLKLDYWKSSKTKPDKKTTAYLIHLEALPPITPQKLKQITQELSNLIKTFCSGKTKIFILHKNKNSFQI